MDECVQIGASTLHLGDACEVMRGLAADSVHAIVTDPPYGLEFMGKDWDRLARPKPGNLGGFADGAKPSFARVARHLAGMQGWHEAWAREALRIARPGAPLLAFGGTRTFHRLACGLEDAGWEVRECLVWLYGQGFPKSLDISKALDRAAGAEREVVGRTRASRDFQEAGRNSVGVHGVNKIAPGSPSREVTIDVTAPATDAARVWSGYGTALKPGWEPVILAMKPLDGTFAENAVKWGVAGLNIDGCRLDLADTRVIRSAGSRSAAFGKHGIYGEAQGTRDGITGSPAGRWPANVALDEEAAAMLDEQSGDGLHGHFPASRGPGGLGTNGHAGQDELDERYMDRGGASRFFYCGKADRRERDAGIEWSQDEWPGDVLQDFGHSRSRLKDRMVEASNQHPTVKALDFMRWLCRLVRPPAGGVILDPFLGSGTTLCAAALEGLAGIGIEQDARYFEIARARIAHWQARAAEFLFAEAAP